jgi:hypothetical protein
MADDASISEQSQIPRLTLAVPDVYVDGARVEVSPVTVTLAFATGKRPSVVVRMSPIYAKIFAVLLKDLLKQAEEKWGEPIAIPEAVLKDRGITLDDW